MQTVSTLRLDVTAATCYSGFRWLRTGDHRMSDKVNTSDSRRSTSALRSCSPPVRRVVSEVFRAHKFIRGMPIIDRQNLGLPQVAGAADSHADSGAWKRSYFW